MISGVTRVYLAEALMLPLGLISAMYLTRRLGPESYGIYTLAIVIVSWVEVTLTAPFRRMTIQNVAGTTRWQPLAAAALRAQVVLATIGAVAVWIAAGAVARACHEPALEAFLRLLAIDMPIFAAAKLHSDALVGRGQYNQRAIASASFWTARLALIILLVELGWSVNGALIGCIGASLIELCVGRLFVRPGLLTEGVPVRQLIVTGLPLLAFDAMMRLFYRVDLLLLKVLGGSASEAAHYAAAQNLALIPSVLAMALSTVLLATLTKMLRSAREEEFRRYSRRAIRFGLILFPFGATAAGCSDELVVLMFGADYAPAGEVLGPLMFGAVATLLVSVGSSILFAAGRAKLALGVITPTLLPAIIGYILVIPQHRSVGAAWVTCVSSVAGALTVLTTVVIVGRITLPVATLARTTVLSILCYFIAAYWNTSAPMLVLKLAAIGVVIPSALLLLREAAPEEREALVALVRPGAGETGD